jgi:hypothetical protein
VLVDEEPWSWRLTRTQGGYVLDVLAGGVGVAEVTFALSDDEAAAWRSEGRAVLEAIAAEVQRTFGTPRGAVWSARAAAHRPV